jgi:hypothetical protein
MRIEVEERVAISPLRKIAVASSAPPVRYATPI